MSNLIGQTIGERYKIIEMIGKGGMAIVYKAYDNHLERDVAIKVIRRKAFTPEEMDSLFKRFEREAKSVGRLSHPNIVGVIDYGDHDGAPYLVMVLVPGGTLKDWLGEPMPWRGAIQMLLPIANALEYVHERNIIHRDIKPSNILMTEKGQTMLTDFGLIKIFGEGDQEATSLTGTGVGLGTPDYMAPEQWLGEISVQSDLYSLGVVLYEMITGYRPFMADTPGGVLLAQANNPLPLPKSYVPDLPIEVESVLLIALAKEPANRYPDMPTFIKELQRLLDGQALLATIVHAEYLREEMTGQSEATRENSPGWIYENIGPPIKAPEVKLQKPPNPIDFIGRKKELAFYREKLEKNHLIAITGAPGIGKSVLGTKLARQVAESEENIFWFNFDPVHKTEADTLFWHLAEFFKQHGDENFSKSLLGELKSKTPLKISEKLALFLDSLENGSYVICLDNFEQVKNVEDITNIFTLLKNNYEGRGAEIPGQIIILGRSLPSAMDDIEYKSLRKFNKVEIESFVKSRIPNLSPALLARLSQSTEGHPKYLDLSLTAIKEMGADEKAVKAFIDNMATLRNIEKFILNEIDMQLSSPEERAVLTALTIFLEKVNRETLEEILADQKIDHIASSLSNLIRKNIIRKTADSLLEIDSIVSEYFYQTLNREERDDLHEHAAKYFLNKRDYIAAAHHFGKRRDTARAVKILTKYTQEIINTGGAAALLERIKDFRRKDVNSEQWLAIKSARGAAHAGIGKYELALDDFKSALTEATTDESAAEIQLSIANIYLKGIENFQEAKKTLTECIQLSKGFEDKKYDAKVHAALGWACYRLRQIEPAKEHFFKGQALAKDLRMSVLLARINLGLGSIDIDEKNYQQARERFERSKIAYRDYDIPRGEAEATGNLGILAGVLGDYEKELDYHKQVIAIFENISAIPGLRFAYINCGLSCYEADDYEQAIDNFQRADEIAKKTGSLFIRCQAKSGLANAFTKLKKLDAAMKYAEQAYQLAGQIEDQSELGISALALGDIWLAKGEAKRAKDFYEESIPLLEEANFEEDLDLAHQGLEQALSQIN